jgi:hypothetical protein
MGRLGAEVPIDEVCNGAQGTAAAACSPSQAVVRLPTDSSNRMLSLAPSPQLHCNTRGPVSDDRRNDNTRMASMGRSGSVTVRAPCQERGAHLSMPKTRALASKLSTSSLSQYSAPQFVTYMLRPSSPLPCGGGGGAGL